DPGGDQRLLGDGTQGNRAQGAAPARPSVRGSLMPEAPTTEPWAGTPPIPMSLRPGAKPEAYFAKIAEGDERLWVPIGRPMVEDVYSKPVWISPTLNMWADVLLAKKPCIVNRHYHPK